MRGKPRSAKTKAKISKNRMGKCVGKNNPMFGKHHSAKAKKKIGEASKGRIWYLWLTI